MAPPDLWSCSVLGQTLVPVPGCALTLKRFAPHINTAYHDFLSSRSSMGNSFGHGKKIMVICSHHICPVSRSEHSWPEFWLWCLGALCALSGLKVFWKKKKKAIQNSERKHRKSRAWSVILSQLVETCCQLTSIFHSSEIVMEVKVHLLPQLA